MSFKVSDAFEAYISRNCGLFYADAAGIDSYKGLVAWKDANGIDSPMPVYRPSPAEIADSVFATANGYMGFQAWHDRRHILFQKRFTLQDEHWLARQHFEELRREMVDYSDAIAVYHLIYSRNVYYHNNGSVAVTGVSQFIEQALKCGTDHAARDRRLPVESAPCKCGGGYVFS